MASKGKTRQVDYLRQSPSGFWTFRRPIPEKLREALGKREWKVALKTKSRVEAAMMADRILQDSEAAFMRARIKLGLAVSEAQMSQYEAWQIAKANLAGQNFQSRAVQDGYAMHLLDLAERGEASPVELEERKIIGSNGSYTAKPTIRDAIKLYQEDQERKDGSPITRRKRMAQIRLVTGLLEAHLGSLSRELDDISRPTARSFVEVLRKQGIAEGTVRRNVTTVAAIFAKGITEFELNRANPFAKLGLTDGDAKEARHPMDNETIKSLIEATSGELQMIVKILAGTGARLGEIAMAKLDDLDLTNNTPSISIRANELRGLKTPSSKRMIPLVGQALEAAREAAARARGVPNESGALFPEFFTVNGAQRVSSLLASVLRKKLGVTDDKLTIHSLRHSFVDALRNAKTPEIIEFAILGHAQAGRVHAAYGRGHAMEIMRDAMIPAQKLLGVH